MYRGRKMQPLYFFPCLKVLITLLIVVNNVFKSYL